MNKNPNILFIMVDQMRADCLSCAGHPVVKTPNLDALASRGVRFSEAYVQSAVCVPSRMSFYTGRYVHAHRSSWNAVPLPSDERTMGHYLREAGYRAVQCGRSHYFPDTQDAWKKDPEKVPLISSTLPGLEEWLSHEASTSRAHKDYLKEKGYPEKIYRYPAVPKFEPRELAGADPSALPVDIREEDSDTAFVTDRALEFLRQAGDRPWFLFLSYWKPHPPFFAPAPYHQLYDPASVPSPNRSESEMGDPHPLIHAYREEFNGQRFDQENNWRQLRATYYGLITQLDHHLGRVFDALRATGQDRDTVILFSSDHGEYLGDHWLQNKEMFYDEAYRAPFIWADPRPEADPARGTVCSRFVECIDALPTFLETAGGAPCPAIQGRSLLPLIRGQVPEEWRTEVHGDWDFRCYRISDVLGLKPHQCRGWMVRDGDYKYWHFNALPDVLFDLKSDPGELRNLADHPDYREVLQRYRQKLLDWRMSTEDPSRIMWTYRMTEDSRRPGKRAFR